jgi:hypothetical protein
MGTDKQTAETGYATLPVLLFFSRKNARGKQAACGGLFSPLQRGSRNKKKKKQKQRAREDLCHKDALCGSKKKKKKKKNKLDSTTCIFVYLSPCVNGMPSEQKDLRKRFCLS